MAEGRESRDEPRAPEEAPPVEGEERPPAGVRTMAAIRWAIVAVLAVAAAASWIHVLGGRGESPAASAAAYQCPMHPAVGADDPGACPICGMDLVRTSKRGGIVAVPAGPGAVPGMAALEISDERARTLGVRVAPVAREALSAEIRTVGFVTPDERRLAVVTARLAGWVDDLKTVQSTSYVRKGDVLATLYEPGLRDRQLQFLNAVRYGSAGRAPTIGPEGRTFLEEAREDLQALGFADVDLEEMARTLQTSSVLRVRAPISGHVVRNAAIAGGYVNAGSELFQIADLSRVWVLAEVYEADVGRVRAGQRARLRVGAYPEREFVGRAEYLFPTVNPATRTMQVRLAFRNPGLLLRPGMFGDVVLELAEASALVVPASAVVDTGDEQYVIVRDGERFEPRRVRTGARDGARVAIAEGLAEGEAVVTTANFLIDSESRLRAALEGLRSRDPAPRDGGGAR